MAQLRTVSIVFAIIASVVAMVAGFILFFRVRAAVAGVNFPGLRPIAIGCFVLAGIAAYFGP